MTKSTCSCVRSRAIEFLIRSAQLLKVSPVVKYSALSLFASRFYPSLTRTAHTRSLHQSRLLHPVEESNLQLFALTSLWISSKIHETSPLPISTLKQLGDRYITEQHYGKSDFLEAEVVLMKAVNFGTGNLDIAFALLEDLLNQLKAVARLGEQVSFEACMDVMDLLYENEEMSLVFNGCAWSLAASVLVCAYVITVPVQRWEFPIVSWVKFVTSCQDEVVLELVGRFLKHVFEPQAR